MGTDRGGEDGRCADTGLEFVSPCRGITIRSSALAANDRYASAAVSLSATPTPPLLDLHLPKPAVPRLPLVRGRILGPLPDPVADLALDDKVGRVGEVVHVLQPLGQLARLAEHAVVLGPPPRLVHLDRVAQVKAEGDPVVVDPRVQDDDARVLALAEAVDAEGLAPG